jgi:hypothetical protein
VIIFLVVWLPLTVLVLAGGAVAAWIMQHDKGQRAAPRGGGRHSPVVDEPRPRPRIIRRKPTASQPPAAITDTPCTEPPAAPFSLHEAETQTSMPAIRT